ncbi:MAG: hypothetical protein JWO10_683 [Microbacteriaceae bacterium]|nr:hypothetical protein [Microbacteriaceae bacterium]
MTDEDTDYRLYAGRVSFPRTPDDLTSTTHCPACFSVLRASTCSVCGLDLGHPAAAQLAAVSQEVATSLDQRLELIGRIRFDTAAAKTAAVRGPAVVASRVAAQAAPVTAVAAPAPTVLAPVTVVSPAAATQTTVGAPRRSSVQVVLLIVGISLLSVAAIFFLVYAFINFGILARSLIIGGITVAAFVVASLLRRGGLRATGEGIAAFAIVLIYLDAFALRANDFFGLQSTDALLYWGWTLVVSSIAFVLWNRQSGLRVAGLAGFIAFAPGLGMIAGAAVEPDERAFVLFSTIALGGLVQRLAPQPATPGRGAIPARAERVIVLGITTVALLVAVVASFGLPRPQIWATTIGLAILVIIAALHVLALTVRTDSATSALPVFGSAFAGFAGLVGASAVASGAIASGNDTVLAFVPLLVAVALSLILEFTARRLAASLLSRPATVAAWSAAAVAVIIAFIPTVGLSLVIFSSAAQGIGQAWALTADARLHSAPDLLVLGLIGLVLASALVGLAWWGGGVLRRRLPVFAWAGGMLLLLATAVLPILWIAVGARLLLAAVALVALVAATRRRAPLSLRSAAATVLICSAALAYFGSWASAGTWLVGTVATTALLVLSRAAVRSSTGRAILIGVTAIILMVGGAAGVRQIALPLHAGLPADAVNGLRGASIIAILLLLASAALSTKVVSIIERRTIFWISAVATAGTVLPAQLRLVSGARVAPLLPESVTSLVLGLVLLAALLAWALLPANTALRPERIAVSLGMATALYWVVDSFTRMLALNEFTISVAPVAAAVLAATGALAVTTLRPSSSPRWTRELGVAIVAVPAVLVAVARNTESTWLVLVLAGVTAIVLAISADGLFASTSPRRHLGWLALALATVGLWWRLGGEGVGDLEPYVLPLAGVLLLVALLLWNARRRSDNPSRASAALALAGLLVAILPIAASGANGSIVRPLVVGAISAALLLVGSLVVGRASVRPYLDAVALAGGIGVLVVTIGRAIAVSSERGDADGRLDAWLAAGLLLLVIAAFGQARDRSDGSVRLRSIAGQAMALLALVSALALELPSLSAARLGPVRALVVVLLFCALHVISLLVNRAPLTRLVGWVSIAFAAIAGITGVAVGALPDIEFATIPISFALLATGGVHMAVTPRARSWAWLAPGTAVLLVPTLAATTTDAPLWRLVGLGVVGLAIVALAAVYRLQAPFIIAALVVIIHAVGTFAPQIRTVYESVEWWLWLAIGGIIIVVLAAMFERSKRGFLRVATTIRSLR